MGSGTYSASAYLNESSIRDYSSKSINAIFTNTAGSTANSLGSLKVHSRKNNTKNIKKEMLNIGVRECRDSEEHPNSTPIIIALDVTGSMGRIPYEMVKVYLPKLMGAIQQMGIPDPQLLFMAVGDHEWDSYPIQIGEFESDTAKILDMLESLYLEGGGGGNEGESYLLAHLIAGYHTETDSWFKRNTKGYLFTIGDEPNLREVDSESLVHKLGYERGISPISAVEALAKAQEQYHVFHIHVTDGTHRLSNSWKELLGDHLLTCHSSEIAKTIAQAIKDNAQDLGTSVKEETIEENEERTY